MRGRHLFVSVAVVASVVAAGAPPAPGATLVGPYVDVAGTFAASAIKYTAVEHNWLQVYGSYFKPTARATRGWFAKALVRAFASGSTVDPTIKFADLHTTDTYYPYMNVVVQKHWMGTDDAGRANADGDLTKLVMDVALVRALGMRPSADLINTIRTSDGKPFDRSVFLGYGIVASQLNFHYNYPNAAGRELLPRTSLSRADAAYALSGGVHAAREWRGWALQGYDIVLPPMTSIRRKVVEFALRYADYPYVYAGSSSAGFDCSGFVWWVLRAGSGPSTRPYAGWSLADRTSYYMAEHAKTRIDYDHLRTGDIVIWDVDGPNDHTWQGAGHAGVYLGNGWFIHSSGSKAGVSIDRMDQGWWRDAFLWGRRVIPSTV